MLFGRLNNRGARQLAIAAVGIRARGEPTLKPAIRRKETRTVTQTLEKLYHTARLPCS